MSANLEHPLYPLPPFRILSVNPGLFTMRHVYQLQGHDFAKRELTKEEIKQWPPLKRCLSFPLSPLIRGPACAEWPSSWQGAWRGWR